mmetsp:Transcript_27005/g.52139  ORF Transcript_27005/g.52139 Transcript_27005/m.52139 type:complete len:90 (-) Transcript_27005:68-337(-)
MVQSSLPVSMLGIHCRCAGKDVENTFLGDVASEEQLRALHRLRVHPSSLKLLASLGEPFLLQRVGLTTGEQPHWVTFLICSVASIWRHE